jgi:serine/threonine protein phosphatase PrpC
MYISNVGDSRAILVSMSPVSTLPPLCNYHYYHYYHCC